MFDFLAFFVTILLKAWQRNTGSIRLLIIICILLALGGGIIVAATENHLLIREIGNALAGSLIVASAFIALGIVAAERLQDEQANRTRIERVEDQARENPDKPQLAWDLARTKLESYLDRNLRQLQSIFWLTSFVMLVGFGFVIFGLIKAYQSLDNFPVSIVASTSGVLISFFGGSFLLIYRSILSNTRQYVVVLERINAVGMAVQVLTSISGDAKLRETSTAKLATQLLDLYAPHPHRTDLDLDNEKESPKRATARRTKSSKTEHDT